MTGGAIMVPVARVVSCPICRGTSGQVYHSATTDRWFGVGGSWAFRKCASCDGLWLDPRPTTAALPLVYTNYYTHGGSPRRGGRPSLGRTVCARLPWHAADRRGAIGYLDGVRPGRVLDVGCGDGSRLGRLSMEGWSTVGVDVDGRAVEASRETIGASVQLGTIHDVEQSTSFDAIIMFHVLEHVEDPEGTLLRARELLRPGGVLAITTPNAASWLHRIYGHRWRGLEPPRHLQVFAESGLRRILGDAGFAQLEISTTERNAGLLAVASETSYGSGSALRRLALAMKGELFQMIEWIRLSRSPYCGEELVAICSRGPEG